MARSVCSPTASSSPLATSLADRVVLGQRDAMAGGTLPQQCSACACVPPGDTHGLIITAQSDSEPERCPGRRCSSLTHIAAHPAGEATADRQAEAGAAIVARRRVIGLFEGLEQARERLAGMPDAAVFDLDAQQQGTALLAAAFLYRGAHDDVAVVGGT